MKTYEVWWCARGSELRPLVATHVQWKTGASLSIGSTTFNRDTAAQCADEARAFLARDGVTVVRVDALTPPEAPQ